MIIFITIFIEIIKCWLSIHLGVVVGVEEGRREVAGGHRCNWNIFIVKIINQNIFIFERERLFWNIINVGLLNEPSFTCHYKRVGVGLTQLLRSRLTYGQTYLVDIVHIFIIFRKENILPLISLIQTRVNIWRSGGFKLRRRRKLTHM